MIRRFLPKSACASLLAVVALTALTTGPAAWAQGTPAVRTQVVAGGLEVPWGLAFLPQGRFLVTERPGRMRVVEADGRVGPPLAGLPPIAVGGQGGLLDVLADSDFASNRTVYFCFSEPDRGDVTSNVSSTALARAVLSADSQRLEQVQVIFSQRPKVASALHFGCRIVESHTGGKPDGMLFLTLGERYFRMQDAQRLDNHHGKIVRIGKDGAVPRDNPFVGRPGALPEIWSYGHRNPQGATWGPDQRLWMNEHGPQGGDEINQPQAGRNYGWPVITYGENYGGGKIGDGLTQRAGMEQPWHNWTPSIAPSGMAFVTSERYPAWRGNLLVGSVKFNYLTRLELSGGKVQREHQHLRELGAWIRDVRQGPDGYLYVLADSPRGQIVRLLP